MKALRLSIGKITLTYPSSTQTLSMGCSLEKEAGFVGYISSVILLLVLDCVRGIKCEDRQAIAMDRRFMD